MNNIENIGIEILEIFTEKQNYDEKYNNLMFSFVTKAYELVDLSEDLYQLERTIKLNQISLKDYILNSEICSLAEQNCKIQSGFSVPTEIYEPTGECLFYFDDDFNIEPSVSTRKSIQKGYNIFKYL